MTSLKLDRNYLDKLRKSTPKKINKLQKYMSSTGVEEVKDIEVIIPPLNTDIRNRIKPTRITTSILQAIPPLPDNFDLRDVNSKLSPVFNQYLCGSCWAVAIATMISDLFVISGGNDFNPNLSPTNLLACDQEQAGCDGGNPYTAFTYIQNRGITSDSCVDYNFCKNNQNCTNSSAGGEFGSQLGSILNSAIPGYNNRICGCYINENPHYRYYINNIRSITENPDVVKNHIMTVGPALAGFHIFSNFLDGDGSFYQTNGIYIDTYDYSRNRFGYQPGSANFQGSHAVVIIGWGTDTINGKKVDYWLCRNSWGRNWGDNGYFKLAMGIRRDSTYIYNIIAQTDRFVDVDGYTTGGILICNPVQFSDNSKFYSYFPNNGGVTKPDLYITDTKIPYYTNDPIPTDLINKNIQPLGSKPDPNDQPVLLDQPIPEQNILDKLNSFLLDHKKEFIIGFSIILGLLIIIPILKRIIFKK